MNRLAAAQGGRLADALILVDLHGQLAVGDGGRADAHRRVDDDRAGARVDDHLGGRLGRDDVEILDLGHQCGADIGAPRRADRDRHGVHRLRDAHAEAGIDRLRDILRSGEIGARQVEGQHRRALEPRGDRAFDGRALGDAAGGGDVDDDLRAVRTFRAQTTDREVTLRHRIDPDHPLPQDPAVPAHLDRLGSLSPGADVQGLERITQLLARLGDPQNDMPRVCHVAGTNGKGSTCAFLRAAIEAAGHDVHVYSSPHLVRFNERIRIAGRLIDDAALAAILDEVLNHAEGLGASFFEVTTAAAFLAFARNPAAATIIEVGLGGRLDATNILRAPAICGIAALGIDHEAFLGRSLTGIAREKAGIAKLSGP